VTVIVYRSAPVSESLGTLPAGTVRTGGMGGGVGAASVEGADARLGLLRGSSFDPEVTWPESSGF
jgi:hypothetical protein